MKVVIFAGGGLEDGYFVQDAITQAQYIIAADSGAETASDFHILPHIVVGDFDSLLKKQVATLKEKRVEMISSFKEKDETDTQLAIQTAINKGATQIAILGGTKENRLDHVFANVGLTRFSQSIPIHFINGNQKIWIEKGPKKVLLEGHKNDLLSLIPVTEVVTHIQTKGLMYPLLDEPLLMGESRGISNVFAQGSVVISFENGMLAFFHTAS